jgi:hypothetical protein
MGAWLPPSARTEPEMADEKIARLLPTSIILFLSKTL